MHKFQVVTPAEVVPIIEALRAGESFDYHIGVLSRDRAKKTPHGRALHALAEFMLCQVDQSEYVFPDGTTAKGNGCGHLVQYRVGGGRFVYSFVKGRV